MEPEGESHRKEEPVDERVFRQINGYGDYGQEEREKEETENVRLVTHGYDKTEALVVEAEKAKIL